MYTDIRVYIHQYREIRIYMPNYVYMYIRTYLYTFYQWTDIKKILEGCGTCHDMHQQWFPSCTCAQTHTYLHSGNISNGNHANYTHSRTHMRTWYACQYSCIVCLPTLIQCLYIIMYDKIYKYDTCHNV